VDFSALAGKNLVLNNNAVTPFPVGAKVTRGTTDRIMQFRVVPPTSLDTSFKPTGNYVLRRGAGAGAAELPLTIGTMTANNVRKVALFEMMDEFGRMQPMLGTPAGFKMFMDPVTEVIKLGNTEVWEIFNNTPDAHPIHLHLVKFQLINRQGFTATLDPLTGAMSKIKYAKKVTAPTAMELSWQDTIIVYPGEVVRVKATFDLPGKYVWHCHILSHEEHDMMRPFVVEPAGGGSLARQIFSQTAIAPNALFTTDRAQPKTDKEALLA
jgi:spore coat protein A